MRWCGSGEEWYNWIPRENAPRNDLVNAPNPSQRRKDGRDWKGTKRPSTLAVRRKGTEHKGTLGKALKDVNGLWDNGWDLDDRSECWAKHIHREHNKAVDDWVDRGMNGEHFL